MNSPARERATGAPHAAGAVPPADVVRAAVTAALVFYLAGLVLTVAGNSSSGSSTLVRTLVDRLYAPWMAPAWLGLGFDYGLTRGGPADGDHDIEVTPWSGGRDATAAGGRRFPGDLSGERSARWRRLARAIAAAKDDSDREGLLAASVARGLFTTLGCRDLAVRVLRRPPRDRGGAVPAAEQVYAARVRLLPGDQLQLLRDEPPEELSPVIAPPAAGGAEASR